MKEKKVIIIGGPTGVGKSSLAMQLAQHVNCPIISADSRQVYKEMSIGTAKPTIDDLSQVKHYGINTVSITESFNAGMFEQLCDHALGEIFKTSTHAVICGGTGFYIDTFLHGLDVFPAVSDETKSIVQSLYVEGGTEGILSKLRSLDPEYANIVDGSNHRRISRALEVCLSSKYPFSYWLRKKKEKNHPYEIHKFWLNRKREVLYNRINQRVLTMLEMGWLEEARHLLPQKRLTPLKTVGYQELFEHLEGRLSYEEAISEIQKQTRRYAKRQVTWFNNQYEGQQLSLGEERPTALQIILRSIGA